MDARAREMAWLRKSKWLGFLTTFFWNVIPVIISIVSFICFVTVAKGKLTVAIAFPALSAFSLLTHALTMVG
jgi:multidrug transporter EmrE-like cation transporter